MFYWLRNLSFCCKNIFRHVKTLREFYVFPRINKNYYYLCLLWISMLKNHNNLLANISILKVAMNKGDKFPFIQVYWSLWNVLCKMTKDDLLIVRWNRFISKYWVVNNPCLSYSRLWIVFMAIFVKRSEHTNVNFTCFNIFENRRTNQIQSGSFNISQTKTCFLSKKRRLSLDLVIL